MKFIDKNYDKNTRVVLRGIITRNYTVQFLIIYGYVNQHIICNYA